MFFWESLRQRGQPLDVLTQQPVWNGAEVVAFRSKRQGSKSSHRSSTFPTSRGTPSENDVHDCLDNTESKNIKRPPWYRKDINFSPRSWYFQLPLGVQ